MQPCSHTNSYQRNTGSHVSPRCGVFITDGQHITPYQITIIFKNSYRYKILSIAPHEQHDTPILSLRASITPRRRSEYNIEFPRPSAHMFYAGWPAAAAWPPPPREIEQPLAMIINNTPHYMQKAIGIIIRPFRLSLSMRMRVYRLNY